MRGDGVPLSPVRRSRITAGVRDGRLKVPHGATVPALPVVPGWKAMSGGGGRGGDRKRTRRRPQKGDRGRKEDEGGQRAAGDFSVELLGEVRQSGADFEGLMTTPGGEVGQGTPVKGGEGRHETPTVDKQAGGLSSSTPERPTSPPFDGAATGEVRRAAETEEGAEGGSQGGRISDDESLTMETLDAAFPAPGPAAESGGGDGLGATSAPESLSPGWSSCSSRNSNDGRSSNSDSFVSDGYAVVGRGEETLVSDDGGMDAGINNSRGVDDDHDDHDNDQDGGNVPDQATAIGGGGWGEEDKAAVGVLRGSPGNYVSDSRSDEERHVDDDNGGGRNASEIFSSSSSSIGRASGGSKASILKNDHTHQPSIKLSTQEG